MPIKFSIDRENQVLRSIFVGEISDSDQLQAYKALFAGEDWVPGYPEIVDLTRADMSKTTSHGLKEVSIICAKAFSRHGITFCPTAVVAPEDLQFGIARMYSGLTGESPESVKVFRNELEALDWINQIRPPAD